MYNVLIAQFKHETNTFSKEPCNIECYKNRNLFFGNELITFFKGVKSEIGAFIDYFEKVDDVTLIPAIAADAMPCGTVTKDVYEIVKNAIINKTKENKIDALLLSLHGAMVLDFDEDGEGTLLKELRDVLGSDIPIYITLDLHANITEKMVECADAMFSFDFYPHTDPYERGIEAADNLYKTLKKEINLVKRFNKLSILIPLLPTSEEPMKSILDKVFEYEKREKVISLSVVYGFFPADIRECGMSIIAQTDGDEKLAEELINEISNDIIKNKELLIKEIYPLKEAVDMALSIEGGPVVLGDVADNPGAGSSGDGTFLLEYLIKNNIHNAAVAHIYDPETVRQAVSAGVGNTFNAKIGGKTYKVLGEPVECEAYVKNISDGIYYNKDEMFHGLKNRIGTTVLLTIGGVEVIVSEKRHQAWDVQIFRANGIEPAEKSVLVVKSSLHFRASYSKIAKKIIDVNLPGIAPADPKMLDYKNVRRPIFPLDNIIDI